MSQEVGIKYVGKAVVDGKLEGNEISSIVCFQDRNDDSLKIILAYRTGRIYLADVSSGKIEKREKCIQVCWLELFRNKGRLISEPRHLLLSSHDKGELIIWNANELKRLKVIKETGLNYGYWRCYPVDTHDWDAIENMKIFGGGWYAGNMDLFHVHNAGERVFDIKRRKSYSSEFENSGYICYFHQLKLLNHIVAVAIHSTQRIELIDLKTEKTKSLPLTSNPGCPRGMNSSVNKISEEESIIVCCDSGDIHVFKIDSSSSEKNKNISDIRVISEKCVCTSKSTRLWSILGISNSCFLVVGSNASYPAYVLYMDVDDLQLGIENLDFESKQSSSQIEFFRACWVDEQNIKDQRFVMCKNGGVDLYVLEGRRERKSLFYLDKDELEAKKDIKERFHYLFFSGEDEWFDFKIVVDQTDLTSLFKIFLS